MTSIEWRYAVLPALAIGAMVGLYYMAPIPQDPAYHNFVDQRAMLGIPNCLDVLSNLAFAVVGFLGLRFCLSHPLGPARTAWTTMFIGVLFVSVGSAYYHVSPNNSSLVWDRLPMTVAFMSLFTALLVEFFRASFAKWLLPAIVIGIASVVYWRYTDDLRPYVWVQFVPLVTLPVILSLSRGTYNRSWLLLVALVWYALAKVAETFDEQIFVLLQGTVSGHTLKHLAAAAGSYAVLYMLKTRRQHD